MRRVGSALVFSLVLAACTGPKMAPYSPTDRSTELSSEKLLPAAEGTLLDRGYLIDEKDEASGKIVTKERTLLGSQIAQEKFKYLWTVETSGGHLKIQIGCRKSNADEIVSCGDEVPEKLVKEQKEIVEQILTEAGGQ
ncbi:MAG: hypothetical protein KC776_33800 [Myxococcales bacterium]|nr:hypothetical protein [Myxococcales bacterium]MCB9577598.1 hypothetical protein [Polyangiaceae bacterium]